MSHTIQRRRFLQLSIAGSGLLWAGGRHGLGQCSAEGTLDSPGCRGSKAKVARLYLGTDSGHWPRPDLDLDAEKKIYDAQFEKLAGELKGIEFTTDAIVRNAADVEALKDRLAEADGILVIQLKMHSWPMINAILAAGKPTMMFAVPYSGHEWAGLGALQKQPEGARLACMFTSDLDQLATAVRPFRAIHHLRTAKILNLTSRDVPAYTDQLRERFGTQYQQIGLEPMLELYNSVPIEEARAEADRWAQAAIAVVEPSSDEIIKSCRLALAFERLLEREQATVMTADCYGSMYEPLCKAHAFPCIGFVRLNDMGLGGICESDIASAMMHIVFQGLVGRPGFISDPTVDESQNSIILAHCLGTRRMDGPDGPLAPYKIRTIMERAEGAVPQVFMRAGEPVTQARLVGTDQILYFTGTIIDAPDVDRGCRTKINVEVDGDVTNLWKNWSSGLHRSTCYGNITTELEHLCRFLGLTLTNELVPV